MFYALPKELVIKRKDYLDIPRNPYEVLYTDKYDYLINDDVFLQLIWESYAWSVWQFIQVPRRDGYGNIPGKWTDYSGDFPLWRLCFVIQNYFRKKFEYEMDWSFQKLFMMPREMQIPWLTYQQFSNLIGNLTDMIVAEQDWQPMIDEIWNNRQMEDYSERKSTYKRDFINKWYCSWNKKKTPIFLDEAIKSGEEISEELLVQLPSPREDFETRILSKQKVEAFFETLDGKDKRILQMRMDGCTFEQIAKFAGYKTSSAVYKRIQKIATAYEDFVLKKYGEFLDIHSKKKKKNKQADKDSHDRFRGCFLMPERRISEMRRLKRSKQPTHRFEKMHRKTRCFLRFLNREKITKISRYPAERRQNENRINKATERYCYLL